MSSDLKWTVSTCGPKNFPSEIYRGSLHYGKKEGAPVPNMETRDNGWGVTGTTYSSNTPKEVPHRLDFVWLSYRENKFYGGSFMLPKAKMENLFEKGYTHIANKINEDRKDTYDEILVGVLPEGRLAVWLVGPGFTTQVGFFQGEETDVSFNDFNPSGIKDRELYVNTLVRQIPAEALAKPIPFGRWETYAKEYSWRPVIQGDIVDHVFFEDHYYYNGNKEVFIHQEANNVPLRNRTVPKRININWARKTDGYRLESEFEFDEEEMFSVFKELYTDPKTEQGELVFKYNAKKDVDIFLKVGDKQKQLKKVTLGTYKSTY